MQFGMEQYKEAGLSFLQLSMYHLRICCQCITCVAVVNVSPVYLWSMYHLCICCQEEWEGGYTLHNTVTPPSDTKLHTLHYLSVHVKYSTHPVIVSCEMVPCIAPREYSIFDKFPFPCATTMLPPVVDGLHWALAVLLGSRHRVCHFEPAANITLSFQISRKTSFQ